MILRTVSTFREVTQATHSPGISEGMWGQMALGTMRGMRGDGFGLSWP